MGFSGDVVCRAAFHTQIDHRLKISDTCTRLICVLLQSQPGIIIPIGVYKSEGTGR
jgi:hypothetical protein